MGEEVFQHAPNQSRCRIDFEISLTPAAVRRLVPVMSPLCPSLLRPGRRGRWIAAEAIGGCLRAAGVCQGFLALCLASALAEPARGIADSAATPSASITDATNGLGSWIWSAETHGRQSCRFWQAFEIPNSALVVRALLRMTVDNEYKLFLDGREVGKGNEWRILTEYDLTGLLSPGTHVLGVDAFNNGDTTGVNAAGVILGLRIEFADGSLAQIRSDESWRLVPETERNWRTLKYAPPRWPRATVIGPLGTAPWWREPVRTERISPERPIAHHFWQTGWFQITLLAVCGIVVLICVRLMAQATLQSKGQQLLQLERARIARDIHDDLGAGLTKLVLLGEVVQSESRLDSETRAQVGQLCERARDLLRAMDEVVWAINSRRDTLVDFSAYLCKYAQMFFSSGPIRCRLDVERDLPATAFDLPTRRNLFLAVKEALNNAAKHSEATELFLRIHRRGEGLSVVVVDNGRGFERGAASQERNGLTNMEQRMCEVGGTCVVSGERGGGCRVEFVLPRLQPQPPPWWRGWRLRPPHRPASRIPSPQTSTPRAAARAPESLSA